MNGVVIEKGRHFESIKSTKAARDRQYSTQAFSEWTCGWHIRFFNACYESTCGHFQSTAKIARDAIGISREGSGVGERKKSHCQYPHRSDGYDQNSQRQRDHICCG
jgi:hypothetical protein